MEGVRDKPELSTFLKVDAKGNLLGLDALEAQQNQPQPGRLTSWAPYRQLTYGAIALTLLLAGGSAGLLYFNSARALAQLSTGAALLLLMVVMPLLFLGYVGYRVLREKSSPQGW
jgi:membrane protein YdbS with pleckstrin-like domain